MHVTLVFLAEGLQGISVRYHQIIAQITSVQMVQPVSAETLTTLAPVLTVLKDSSAKLKQVQVTFYVNILYTYGFSIALKCAVVNLSIK